MKKALALILSCMIIMSVCVVSAATTVASDIPVNGVIFSDDFESYEERTDAIIANDGIWSRFGYSLATVDNKQMWSNVNTADPTGVSFMLWDSEATFGTGKEVNSGILTYEIEYYIPEEGELESGEQSGMYIGLYSNATWNPGPINIPVTVCYNADGPTFYFATKSISTTAVNENAMIAVDGNFGYSTVKIVINFDEATVNYYLEDTNVGTLTTNAAGIQRFALGYFYPYSLTSKFEKRYDDIPKVYIDSVKASQIFDDENAYVPSTELREPKVLLEETFTDETELSANWRAVSTAETSVADGVVSIGTGNEIHLYIPLQTSTDIYELSYDIYSESSSGRMVVYDYSIPGGAGTSSANFGAYYPGVGFSLGRSMNGDCGGASATANKTWYTVKVEWCQAENNRYQYYTVTERESGTVVGTKFVRGMWVNASGNEVSKYMPMQAMMFWNHASGTFLMDNFVVKQLPTSYNQKTFHPQVWVNNILANSDTAFRSGATVEAQAYAPNFNNAQLILAAYDGNGELMGTKVAASSIRDEFKIVFTIEEGDAFEGATYVKAFLLGKGASFKPITGCYNSATVAPAA